ncbi:MAG: DUF188 domain-containing protein [Desulfobacterales bacterium]|nr:DUF188 domain-containing protein [Desulfobacterales bacterium]
MIKASLRLNIPLIFVANKPLRLEKLANLSLIMVPEGPDVADDRIAQLVQPGDLVITADIPLADRVVAKKAFAINPRGKLYTEHNIKDRLAMRDLLNELRDNWHDDRRSLLSLARKTGRYLPTSWTAF